MAGPGAAIRIDAAMANEVSRAHEVSILMAAAGIAVGLCRGDSPALNTLMMRMGKPQHGHRLLSTGGSEAMSCGSGACGATSSSLRASARLSAFTPLASRP